MKIEEEVPAQAPDWDIKKPAGEIKKQSEQDQIKEADKLRELVGVEKKLRQPVGLQQERKDSDNSD